MLLRATAVVCLLIFGCHAERPAPNVNDEPTLAILGPDGVICAAVAITPALAVTANHCVSDKEVTFVTASRNGQADRTVYGVVVAREEASDLAVFTGTALVPAVIAPGRVDYEHATTLITHVPAPWTVTRRRPLDASQGFLKTDRLELGMSGSGLWDDGGRLVGIAVGNDQSLGYFADRARIRRLVDQVPHPQLGPDPAAPAALWGDPNLDVAQLIAGAERRRRHIESGLERLETHPYSAVR
jgi:hypothetical protein